MSNAVKLLFMKTKNGVKIIVKVVLIVFFMIAFTANCKDKINKNPVSASQKPQIVTPAPAQAENTAEEVEKTEVSVEKKTSDIKEQKPEEMIMKEGTAPQIRSRIRPLDPPALPVIPLHKVVEAEKKVDFVLKSVKKNQEDFTKELSTLSGLGFAACKKLRTAVKNPKLPWKKRWLSAMALGRIGGDYSRFTLLEVLEDESSLVKMAACIALKNFKDEEVVEELHRVFLEDKGMLVRNTIIDTLVKIGNPKSIPILAAGLDNSQNYYRGKNLWIRNNIVYALGKLKNKKAVPHLIDILNKKDSKLYDITLKSLVYIVEPKEESLKDDKVSPDEKIKWWLSWWDRNKKDFL